MSWGAGCMMLRPRPRFPPDDKPSAPHVMRSQRTVTRRCEPKRGFKPPGKMRLVCTTRLEGHIDQRPVPRELGTCKIQTSHEHIAVGAGPVPAAKLTGQRIACESGHGFQLR